MFNRKKYYKQYGAQWYRTNSKLTKTRSYKFRKRLVRVKQIRIIEYLRNHPCVDCGEKDIVVLQFDHIRGKKKYLLSTIVSGGHSWETVSKEISKCEVRCANCHIRKTAKDFKYYRLGSIA